MAVRTKRLSARASLVSGAAATTLYTCPAGRTAIVKAAAVRTAAGIGVSVALALLVGGNPVESQEFVRVTTNVATTFLEQTEWVVLEPGDKVVAIAAGGNGTVVIFGTELDGVAP